MKHLSCGDEGKLQWNSSHLAQYCKDFPQHVLKQLLSYGQAHHEEAMYITCFENGLRATRTLGQGHAILVVRNIRSLLHPEGRTSSRSGLHLITILYKLLTYLAILVHVFQALLHCMCSYHLLWGLRRNLRRKCICISLNSRSITISWVLPPSLYIPWNLASFGNARISSVSVDFCI